MAEYSDLFGRATRTAFSLRNRIGRTNKKASELEKLITNELELRYKLSNSEARNAYTKALAVYDSQAALIDTYIEDNQDKIKGIERTIRKLEAKLKKATKSNQSFVIKGLKRKIHFKKQKINKLTAKIKRQQASKESGKFSVTFGSSKLFKSRNQLALNGYQSPEKWLEDWQSRRSNRAYFIGAKNFQTGNQLVRYDFDTQTLRLTVSPALELKYGKHITFQLVSFQHGHELLLDAVQPVKRESTRKGKNGEKVADIRTGSKLPVTYELVHKDEKLYLHATIESESPVKTTLLKNGAIGIDFNPGSIDWTVIDRHGNLRRHGSIKTNVQDKRSNQTKDIIGKVVAELSRIALHYNVPIVIEDLDFEKKKVSMKEKGKKYARMLSNMAYRQFIQMLESRCERFGIELIKVDPAYTSVIGVTKYMAVYGLNSGCAAALVIARRGESSPEGGSPSVGNWRTRKGQGRVEKLPTSLLVYFKKPEDFKRSTAWRQVSKKINICGGFNRHKFYHLSHKKQVKTNCLLYGKRQQTTVSSKSNSSKRGNTVYVLRAPHTTPKKTMRYRLP